MSSNPQISPALSALFTPESSILRARPRLALSIEALDKAGKTHYAIMTAPDPIAVVTNDPGTQTVVDKAKAAGKVVHQFVMNWQAPSRLVKSAKEVDTAEWEAWANEWNRYVSFISAVEQDRGIRTIVKDTETDLWHLAELAYFGKLAGNSSMDIRPKLNYAYSQGFWDLYKRRPDLNIILIHRLKKKYIKAASKNPDAPADWNGEYETDGYSKVAFMVDATVRCGWDPLKKDFYSEFDSNKSFRHYSTDNAHILNKRWYAMDAADPSAFWNLGMEVFPETANTPEVWGI